MKHPAEPGLENEPIAPAFDRLQEAHFWLHGREAHYHNAGPFRWHLNAFLRAIKEVPQLLRVGINKLPGRNAWLGDLNDMLKADPLIEVLVRQRNFVVHQGMLMPMSSAAIGITEGRGIKLGVRVAISPFSDSDQAMKAYIAGKDFLGLLIPDEDSLPCIERHWRLSQFPTEDAIDICARAWLLTAAIITEVFAHLGLGHFGPDLKCRHSLEGLRFRVYDRQKLEEGVVEGFRYGET